MRVSVDIETALYDLLTADGYSASAHVIPATLGKDLPHVHVVRTGGYTSDMVIETHNLDFDVYAEITTRIPDILTSVAPRSRRRSQSEHRR